jgi:probable phosphoglycerate mutase
MKLVLVRHGETDWNKLGRFQGHRDVELNEKGSAQAQETAPAVAKWQHSAVYSSPLHRAMRVAEEISLLSGMPVVPVPEFMELKLGDLEGITGEDLRKTWPELAATWRSDPGRVLMPNGESLAQLQERAWCALMDLEQAHQKDEAVIVVSHNFAIRTMIGKLLGVPLSNFHRMSLNLASICVIECDRRGRRLVTYNSTFHLSPENR